MCECLYVLKLLFICTHCKGKPAASTGNPLKLWTQLTASSHPHIHSCFTINGLTQMAHVVIWTSPLKSSAKYNRLHWQDRQIYKNNFSLSTPIPTANNEATIDEIHYSLHGHKAICKKKHLPSNHVKNFPRANKQQQQRLTTKRSNLTMQGK